MALKIRLRQQGRKNRQTYRLVVADVRYPRDGKYLEMVGWYQPAETENNLFVDADRISHWLKHGAQMTDQVRTLVSKTAPQIVKDYQAQVEAKKVKLAAKRRASKKASAKSAETKAATAKPAAKKAAPKKKAVKKAAE